MKVIFIIILHFHYFSFASLASDEAPDTTLKISADSSLEPTVTIRLPEEDIVAPKIKQSSVAFTKVKIAPSKG